jgi:hypothetical protein
MMVVMVSSVFLRFQVVLLETTDEEKQSAMGKRRNGLEWLTSFFWRFALSFFESFLEFLFLINVSKEKNF